MWLAPAYFIYPLAYTTRCPSVHASTTLQQPIARHSRSTLVRFPDAARHRRSQCSAPRHRKRSSASFLYRLKSHSDRTWEHKSALARATSASQDCTTPFETSLYQSVPVGLAVPLFSFIYLFVSPSRTVPTHSLHWYTRALVRGISKYLLCRIPRGNKRRL